MSRCPARRAVLLAVVSLLAHPACQKGTAVGDGVAAVAVAGPETPSGETGLRLLRQGDLAGAETNLAGALEGAPPDRPVLQVALASVYARTDRFNQAEALLREALRSSPGSVPAHLVLIDVLMGTGRFEEALTMVESTRRLDPADASALVKEALLEARVGDPRRAEAAARRAIEQRPGDGEAWYVLGLALARRGSLEEAAGALRQANARIPSHLGTLGQLSRVLTRLGRADEAKRYRDEHRAALGRLRVEERVRENRLKAVDLFNRGDFTGALAELQVIAREDPNDPQVHLYLGSTYIGLGERDKARAALRRSLDLDPRSERAYMEMGRLLAIEGRLDEAIQALTRAATLNPDFAEPHYFLAGIHRARGEADLYRAELQRYEAARSRSTGSAMQLAPGDGDPP